MTKQLKKWQGDFGREYTDRSILSLNEVETYYMKTYGITRFELNSSFLEGIDRSIRILEIGANVGIQLYYLQKLGFMNLYGVEPQYYAVQILQKCN